MNNETKSNIIQANAEKNALTAHDLRSIFSGIYGLNNILADKLKMQADPELFELIKLISSQCELGLDVISGLVKSYQLSYFSLNKLISDLLYTYRYQADLKEITLEISLPDREIYISSERVKLVRVLNNLLDNAIKFTHRFGSITISLKQENNQITIEVRDTGIGIPNSFYSDLFSKRPKIQRQGTEDEPTTGLGLYICKQLITDLKGHLSFRSVEHKGTTFNIILDASANTGTAS
ncbi:MAG: sensor histidine kinase [Sediminibacterium sp.]